MRYSTCGLILFLTFAVPGIPELRAQGGETVGLESNEEEHAAEHDEGLIPDVIERWFNFLVLFGGLGFLLRKPAGAFFESRRQGILGGLDRARTTQQDAQARMTDIDGRLQRLEVEVKAIRSEADASAQAEHERIVADARQEAQRALNQSKAEVERLARGLGREVRAHVADRLIAQTETRIRSRLTPGELERSVKKAVEQL